MIEKATAFIRTLWDALCAAIEFEVGMAAFRKAERIVRAAKARGPAWK
jgi:hypothetical protein